MALDEKNPATVTKLALPLCCPGKAGSEKMWVLFTITGLKRINVGLTTEVFSLRRYYVALADFCGSVIACEFPMRFTASMYW
jgi:hypothetical protein